MKRPQMNGWEEPSRYEDDFPEFCWGIIYGTIFPVRFCKEKRRWYIDWESDHPDKGLRFDREVDFYKPRKPTDYGDEYFPMPR